jgi:hypothetical protein
MGCIIRLAIKRPDLGNDQQKVLIPRDICAIYALDVRHAPANNIFLSPSIVDLAKASGLKSRLLRQDDQKSPPVREFDYCWPI